ncbi:MAG: bifunctional biotin--[acetyl-CoA-carboxylase] ligase/biotin operon repressor BirA [Pseudohongiellaceae bacterium]|nr:bifunctional biotin--[acetyl-CoA-carboxylase] ligase/biotin operon repressor BirA [Pseudohongiellaceae bacterium]
MDLHPLLAELSDGAYHSGAKLGEALGISRAAIWKQVERLREMGVEVHSVTGKGYRLPNALGLLNGAEILHHLGDGAARWRDHIVVSFSTDSTNADALRCSEGNTDSWLVLAEHQSQGRGRRGRTWVSPVGANIYFSMGVAFDSGVAAMEGLSLVVGLALVRTLDEMGCYGAGLKWPNDIQVEGKKIAGILLEMSGDVTGPCRVIIGIGLNIRMPEGLAQEIGQPYTDLSSELGELPNRNKIIAKLILQLDAALQQFRLQGFEPFKAEWESRDVNMGRLVELSAGRNSVRGMVKGLTSTGALCLETSQGESVFTGGELLPSLRAVSGE